MNLIALNQSLRACYGERERLRERERERERETEREYENARCIESEREGVVCERGRDRIGRERGREEQGGRV